MSEDTAGTMPLGTSKEPACALDRMPSPTALVERYEQRSGRDTRDMPWYDVFARWKLAIVLEGSYAKFLRGQSNKPIHEYFGRQADLLLASAAELIERPQKGLIS
jgi:aminoglycoside phosphotransferase (APT) family kinase protein